MSRPGSRWLTIAFMTIVSSVSLTACRERPPVDPADAPPRAARLPQPAVPAPAPREVPLWPEGSRPLQEAVRALAGKDYAVTHPSFLLYRPQGRSARAAVLVFPGGGFKALAIGRQSTLGFNGGDVCKWLTDAGVTCILVKYRVPNTACNWNPETRRHEAPDIPMALQDAQRAISIVRHRAGEYGIDAGKIGVMGFSAGGHLAVLSSTAFDTRAYAPVDESTAQAFVRTLRSPSIRGT